ncbi:MAG: ClbS/DfsB family four-helix bundle protein [Candidatus Cloacimonetes bacterium]|nr:ClbS/DfsB family four-helix bundle protein [Candidatus Cloacimonadota bacterium]
MVQYKNKQELIEAINKAYEKFVVEFLEVKNEDIHKRIESVEKTPAEMIAYQIGWLNHIIQWEKDELAGKEVITPAPGIKWNEIGKLVQTFYDKHNKGDLKSLLSEFAKAKDEFVEWVATLDAKTLFELNQRKWAYIKAGWPVWKWLHINSVAPFTNFRPQIRKWKKENIRK